MPQEFHVIRCFACSVFQVHQVKKKPKWQCKMCGEKQSVRKVYGRGSGKECRLLVQSLNMTAGQVADEDTHCQPAFAGQLEEEPGDLEMNENMPEIDDYTMYQQQSSKWNLFCEDEPEEELDESNFQDQDGCKGIGIPSELITTERPTQFKRKNSKSNYSREPSGKRFRQDRNADLETLPSWDQQERGLHHDSPAYESMKAPSRDSQLSIGNVRQQSQDIHPTNIRPTHSSSLEMSSTARHYEGFNAGQSTTKSCETADDPLRTKHSNVAMNMKKTDYKHFDRDVATSSHYNSTKGNEKAPPKSSAASAPSNSKWAVFAEPESDNDDGADFGEEADLDVNFAFERKSLDMPAMYEQCTDGDAFEEYSTPHPVSERNESVSNRSWRGEEPYLPSNLCENQHHKSRTFWPRTTDENSATHPDSYQHVKVEGKNFFKQPVARRSQSDTLNSIQKSGTSSTKSFKTEVLQAQQTNSDPPLLSISQRKQEKYQDTNQQHTKSVHSFQVPDEDLEDLPDDFDVW